MRIPPEYDIGQVCGNDPTRPHLEAAWLDVKQREIFATNGYAFAVVPVTVEPSDRTGFVPRALLKEIRRRKWPAVMRKGIAVLGDVLFRRQPRNAKEHPLASAKTRDGFVDFERGTRGTFTIGLDPFKLLEVCRAIGLSDRGSDCLVAITFKPSSDKYTPNPLLIEGRDARGNPGCVPWGILMPARID